MPLLVTRLDASLVEAIDELVELGVVATRSEAVLLGLEQLVDQFRRDHVAAEIVAAYRVGPQVPDELGWTDEATARMITDEPC